MKIQLTDHFDYRRLLRFSLPTIIMIICTSIYCIVDGFFVSNVVGKTAFASINLIMPVLIGVGSIGLMFGTGGSAMIAKLMGQKKQEEAQSCFSMLVYMAIIIGIFVSFIGFIFTRPIAAIFGAKGEMLEYCVTYGHILFCSMPAYILQYMFQSLFVTAEKPKLALKVNILAGIINILLDALFIVVFQWGVAGAAIATALGEIAGGLIPLIYFARKNGSLLRLTKMKFNGSMFMQACINGSSEMVTNLSSSIVNMLYNYQLMRLAGNDGISAYGIIMYINIIFVAVYIGYSLGSSPIVSYNYGAENHSELKNLFHRSLRILSSAGIIQFVAAEILAIPLIMIFASYDKALLDLTVYGFRIYSLSFLVMGFNIWGSSFFTALNDGTVSATISFLRTLVFQVILLLFLPAVWGLDGILLSNIISELSAFTVTVIFLYTKRKKYQYV